MMRNASQEEIEAKLKLMDELDHEAEETTQQGLASMGRWVRRVTVSA